MNDYFVLLSEWFTWKGHYASHVRHKGVLVTLQKHQLRDKWMNNGFQFGKYESWKMWMVYKSIIFHVIRNSDIIDFKK